MVEKYFKAMLVSVGGTPSPIIFSLNKAKPEYIGFFVSRQTKKMLEEEILPKLDFKPRHHDWVITRNADLLSECYSQLTRKLPEWMEKWELKPEEICVDYTGGTKTMSAALVLATIEKSCCYSYVGGDERSKDGIGIVVNGKEKMWFLDNPWDEIAVAEKREISILFNKARYASAVDVLERCISKVSKEHKPFLIALREMVGGYELWDRFKHSNAKKHLYRSQEVLLALSSENRDIKTLVIQMEGNRQFLENLLAGKSLSKFYFYDLLANAKRRADLEHKFDDGVARLYRAIEVLAQTELKETFGINTSKVTPDSIPERIRGEFIRQYQEKEGLPLKIPLYGSYRLLKELGSSLAQEFFRLYDKELKKILDIRNSSILAHGFFPVSQETYQQLWEAILAFSGTKKEDLPEFPFLNL